MLPKDWRRCTLGDIAQVTSGGTPDRSEPRYWGGSIPWVTTGEIRFNTIVDTAEKITEDGLQNSSAKLFPPGTLLMAMYGQGKTRGQVAKLGINAATNQACAAVLLKQSYDVEFYFQYLASQYDTLRELGNAGTQKNLNGGLIKQIHVPVPSLVEQQRIAGALTTWDRAIATTERLLDNSRLQRWALLACVLNLPVSNGASRQVDKEGYPASVQSGIPKLPQTPPKWRRIPLGMHLREVMRPVKLDADCEYTLVTVKRSRGGVHKREILRGSEIKTPTQFEIKSGDFLISKRQIVHGACGVVPPLLDGAIVSNEYAVLSTDGEIDLGFLRYLSESRYFQQTCFHSSVGVHVEKMLFRTDRWLLWPFNIPPFVQQRRIVEILDVMSLEVETRRRQLETLRKEKAALMQQLLTGKRRLPVSELESEALA